ncbi:uncharacterized protein LOC128883438 [Hylaeus volcanicus]|uniref:uncharacterized protein LOC128883438 n=1 Tax=Hylaeus volcanicus TaxID=313075 RepID=UPI0023B7DA44|nr:uncharacterized protein LOC128883438 [Hylaeus volcanicus]XP_053991772.1 uncharacterized protein LOC128883438 [Hylaeus volcanicus]
MFFFYFFKTKKCADNKSCDLNELNRHIGKEINSELYVKMLRFSQKSSTPKDMEMTMSVSNDMKSILAVAQSLKSILSIIGFKVCAFLQDSNDCLNNSLKNMQSLRECGLDFFTEAAAAFDTLYESALLSTRVLAGGRKAQNALARLTHIFTAPYGPQCLRGSSNNHNTFHVSCPLPFFSHRYHLALHTFRFNEATPDHLRWQALSLVTLLSNVPSATTIDDVSSGGFGHVNIVLPSPSRIYEPGKLAQELTLGLNPNVLPEGNLYENEVLSSDESF